MNCPHITLQPGWKPKDGNVGPVFDQLQKNLERIAPINKDKNISISVEPHHGAILEKPAEALRLVRAFWPAIGITYDPSHFCMQDIPLPETAPLLEFTTHVHVRNASSGQMQDTMENGKVDLKWLISALKDHKYDGPMAIEYFRDFDPEFKTTMALKKLLEELL
jgi:sugar phosphate isomerase/epimerase